MALVARRMLAASAAAMFFAWSAAATPAPILLYHTLEELSESSFNSLVSSSGIHWGRKGAGKLGPRDVAAALADGLHAGGMPGPVESRLEARQSTQWLEQCNARAQMFAGFTLQDESRIIIIVVVLILVNVPISIAIWAAARWMGLKKSKTAKPLEDGFTIVHSGPVADEKTAAPAVNRFERVSNADAQQRPLRLNSASTVGNAQGQWQRTSCLAIFARVVVATLTALLYLCSWATVLLVPFAIEAYSVCTVDVTPSTQLLAGLWTMYGVLNAALIVVSTFVLLRCINKVLSDRDDTETLQRRRRRRRRFPIRLSRQARRDDDAEQKTTEKQMEIRTAEGEGGMPRRPSQAVRPVNSAPRLSLVGVSNERQAELPSRDGRARQAVDELGEAPSQQDLSAVLRNPYGRTSGPRYKFNHSRGSSMATPWRMPRPPSSRYTRASVELEREHDTRRQHSPAPSSCYGRRQSVATTMTTATTTTAAARPFAESVNAAWFEFAEGMNFSPYANE